MIQKIYDLADTFARGMDWLAPGFLLALRGYVAMVFFKSGLTKIMDFSSTVKRVVVTGRPASRMARPRSFLEGSPTIHDEPALPPFGRFAMAIATSPAARWSK